MCRTGIQIPEESKLLVLEISNTAKNNPTDFYIMIHELKKYFISNFEVKSASNLANDPK